MMLALRSWNHVSQNLTCLRPQEVLLHNNVPVLLVLSMPIHLSDPVGHLEPDRLALQCFETEQHDDAGLSERGDEYDPRRRLWFYRPVSMVASQGCGI